MKQRLIGLKREKNPATLVSNAAFSIELDSEYQGMRRYDHHIILPDFERHLIRTPFQKTNIHSSQVNMEHSLG